MYVYNTHDIFDITFRLMAATVMVLVGNCNSTLARADPWKYWKVGFVFQHNLKILGTVKFFYTSNFGTMMSFLYGVPA